MFVKGEYVFYESGGICRVMDVQTAPLSGMPEDRVYYVLQSLHDRNGVMYIPVDNDKVFLRPLMQRKDAEAFLNRISGVEVIKGDNAKQLRNRYIDAMHTHNPEEWVRVIKTVYNRANTPGAAKRLSDTERAFAESAKRYLYTELALALDLNENDMERYITQYIGDIS